MSESYQSGVRFRARPSVGLAAVLRQWIGCQRFVYNGKVSEDALFAAQRRMQLASGVTDKDALSTPLDQLYSHFKDRELTPWLYQVPSQVLRNGAYRWMSAKQRQLKKLARAPARRTRRNFNSVLLTDELFRFVPDAKGELVLELGTRASPIGVLPFKAHRPYATPKVIVIRNEAGRWYVSFSFEHESELILRAQHELAYELNRLDDDTLAEVVTGLDRNVRDNCLADSTGQQFQIDQVNLDRIARKEKGARRYQRKLARTQKGSANRRKMAQKIARRKGYGARVRKDFSHKTTHAQVMSDARMLVREDLRVKNMTRRPKAKQDPVTGKWLPNGARAKAGLNAKILASCWGEISRQLEYKAARCNKLAVTVPAQYSSQECSRCEHTHPDNREGTRFVCQRCGFEAHADENAAQVIKARGIAKLRKGDYEVAKTTKRVAFRRRKVGGTETDSILVTGGPPGSLGAKKPPGEMSVE